MQQSCNGCWLELRALASSQTLGVEFVRQVLKRLFPGSLNHFDDLGLQGVGELMSGVPVLSAKDLAVPAKLNAAILGRSEGGLGALADQ